MLSEFGGVRPPVELYDLQADPWEHENLADRAELAAIQADLRRRLLRWMEQTDDPLLDSPVASPYYADALNRLRAS